MTEPDFETRQRRTRSPSYPAIGLEDAIGRAATIYRKHIMHPARVGTVFATLGYSQKSGPGAGVLAALIKFGLIDDEGTSEGRQVKITEVGRRIILRPLDSPERIQLVRDAALRPSIHRELWERFGPELPDDALLKDFLIVDRAFNPAVVNEFIEEYRDTLSYAGLLGDGTLATESEDGLKPDSEEEVAAIPTSSAPTTRPVVPASAPATASREEIRLPLFNKALVTINWSARMTFAEWDAMSDAIKALKPLVAQQPEQSDEPPAE